MKKVRYYVCPVCQKSSSDKKEIEAHYKKHKIIVDDWVYCSICGAGWLVAGFPGDGAEAKAERCEKSHRISNKIIKLS